ncbi:MAG: hypothetical protein QGG40_02940 [Myxococcota bacterium]|nr:hypothetical protein [Myxococcota bacterium]
MKRMALCCLLVEAVLSGRRAVAADGVFGQARLVDGTPEFIPSARFYRFLTGSMAEQGFTFEGDSLAISAVTSSATGLVVGGRLDSFPLTPPRSNLSGKEENTEFSPVLPRIQGGWLVGDPEGMRWSVGGSFLPPVRVQGAAALVLGAHSSCSRPRKSGGRHGYEVDGTFARALAPVTASEEQFEDRDSFGNPDNLDVDTYDSVCGSDEEGCVDTFQVAQLALRYVRVWNVGPLRPYAKVGLSTWNEQLEVMYDGTTWVFTSLHPTLHGGVNWPVLDRLQLGLGSSLAPRYPSQSVDGVGAFFKLEGALGWVL